LSVQTGDGSTQRVFDALSDSTRRTIIDLLAAQGQMTASEIYSNFQMTNPAVSQHLKILREADLVKIEKNAQRHLYSLNPGKIRDLEYWVKRTLNLWEKRFEQLDRVLEAEKKKQETKKDRK
jgi:DNA-binding transcriptional ArsR family regulator